MLECCCCRRRGGGERLPRGWKVAGDAIFCRQCRRQLYRLRSITTTVIEPVGAEWQELRAALEGSWIHAVARDGVWEARIAEGQPAVRVLVRDRWLELRLKYGTRSGGGEAAYQRIASGAAHGQLFFPCTPTADTEFGNGSGDISKAHSEIKCRILAWLPREQTDAMRPQDAGLARGSPLDPTIRHLEEMDIRDVREAIRANHVSFPSQVPTFQNNERPDLQRKLAQLYFVLGWNCGNIGARYGLDPVWVQHILNTWKNRAVKAGYIQHIPMAEAERTGHSNVSQRSGMS
jgi:hypothetical protein